MEEYKIITDVDEITEEDIKNQVKYKTIYSQRYFTIQYDKDEGYVIYGMVCGDNPTYITKGDYVHTWKTYKGVIKGIKAFAKNDYWDFGNKFPQYKNNNY